MAYNMKGFSGFGNSPLKQDKEEIYATDEERKEFKPNPKTGEIVSRNKPYSGYRKIKGTNIWRPPSREEYFNPQSEGDKYRPIALLKQDWDKDLKEGLKIQVPKWKQIEEKEL